MQHLGQAYTTQVNTETYYIGPMVYESKFYSNAALSSLQYQDKLQFIAHEEGRTRALYNNASKCRLVGGMW